MFILYCSLILLASFITYISYVYDKKKALNHSNKRTKEKTLLLESICGGALGGLIAMYTVRHKTKHWYFVVCNVVSLAIQIVILIYIHKYFGFYGFTLI